MTIGSRRLDETEKTDAQSKSGIGDQQTINVSGPSKIESDTRNE